LGLLLGDGCIKNTRGHYPVKITTMDVDHVRCYVDALGLPTVLWGMGAGGKQCGDVVLGEVVKPELEQLGLLGTTSSTKFIPRIYQINSVGVRLALLQGLMDTDGCIDRSNNSVRFYTTSPQLAEGTAFVARSLGFYACVRKRSGRVKEKYTDYKGDAAGPYHCSDCFEVYLSAMNTADLFRLERKRAKCKPRQKPLTVSVDSVEKTGRKVEMRCITVSHPNGLYLTDGFTVTHNSKWLCMEGLQLSLDYPGNVGFMGRHELNSFKATTYKTLLESIPDNLIRSHHLSDRTITLINGSKIMYGGLKPTGSGTDRVNPLDRIKSMELGWFAIDESSEVVEQAFLLLASRLRLMRNGARPHYRGLLASNPEPGWLKVRFVDQRIKAHRFIPALPKDNPHLPEDYEEQLRQLFPDEWVQKYLDGSWDALEGHNYVFPFGVVNEAISRDLDEKKPCILAVDPARYGGDKTVITCRRGNVYRTVFKRPYLDLERVIGAVVFWADELQPRQIIVDSVGLGAGVYDRLKKLKLPVREFVGGGKARKRIGQGKDSLPRFLNKRAEAHWNFRSRLIEGKADLADDVELKSQLASLKYEISADRVLKIVSKETMRDHGIPSPDDADAHIMAAWADNRPPRRVYWATRK